MIGTYAIPLLSGVPILGPILFSQSILLYVTVALVVLAEFVLFRTRFGLNIRAVGENPYAAANAGISVVAIRYAGVLLSGAGAGAAGGYLVLAQIGLFRDTIVVGQGFIALAIVIFGRWRPVYAALAAVAFGAADALQLSLQLFAFDLPPQLLLSLPYVLTVIAVSGLIGRASQPAALMEPYRGA
jgi:simple sugar transport system permease protein